MKALQAAQLAADAIGVTGSILDQLDGLPSSDFEERYPCPAAVFYATLGVSTARWRIFRRRKYLAKAIGLAVRCTDCGGLSEMIRAMVTTRNRHEQRRLLEETIVRIAQEKTQPL